MRVLHVVTHMNCGGLETMIMNYYRNIDRQKVQFDFLTHREYDGDYGEEIKALGGKIYHLPVLNPLSSSYKKALNDFFKEHKEYEVVHVHQDCLSSVILKVAQNNGVKIRIAHSHSSSQDKDLKYPIKLFYKCFISKYATKIMACSEEAGKWMFNGSQFEVINNAINASRYSFNHEKRIEMRATFNIADDELLIGHVGRFSPAKNHELLIDIFNEIQKENKAKLILVGEGILKENIENKVKELGISDKVIFTGLRSDVADLMQAMDVFLFPSNYEGLPVTLVEAQAAGLPCLISDKVPIECKKTDLVEQIALSEDVNMWSKEAVALSKIERKNTYQEIKRSGFDIKENAMKLQKFYLDSVKEN